MTQIKQSCMNINEFRHSRLSSRPNGGGYIRWPPAGDAFAARNCVILRSWTPPLLLNLPETAPNYNDWETGRTKCPPFGLPQHVARRLVPFSD